MECTGVAAWVLKARIGVMLGFLLLWQSALTCDSVGDEADPLKKYEESFIGTMGKEAYSGFFPPKFEKWQDLETVRFEDFVAKQNLEGAMSIAPAINVEEVFAGYLWNQNVVNVQLKYSDDEKKIHTKQVPQGEMLFFRLTRSAQQVNMTVQRHVKQGVWPFFFPKVALFCGAMFEKGESGLVLWAIDSENGFVAGVYNGNREIVRKTLVYHRPWDKSEPSLGPKGEKTSVRMTFQGSYMWEYTQPSGPLELLVTGGGTKKRKASKTKTPKASKTKKSKHLKGDEDDSLEEYKKMFHLKMLEPAYWGFFHPELTNWQNLETLGIEKVVANQNMKVKMAGNEEIDAVFAAYMWNQNLEQVKLAYTDHENKKQKHTLGPGESFFFRTSNSYPASTLKLSVQKVVEKTTREYTLVNPAFYDAVFKKGESGLALWAMDSEDGFFTAVYRGDTVTVKKGLVFHQLWDTSEFSLGLDIKLGKCYTWKYINYKKTGSKLTLVTPGKKEKGIRKAWTRKYGSNKWTKTGEALEENDDVNTNLTSLNNNGDGNNNGGGFTIASILNGNDGEK